MAISGGDGSIILDTRVNTAGVNKGLQTIKNTVSQVGKALAGVFAVREMIRFSNTASQMATQTEASVQRLVDIYGEAAQSVGDFIDANAKAIGMSRSAGASIASTYGNLLSVWADQATNAELTNSLLNQTAVVASKTGRTTTDVAERIRSGLLGNTEAIEDLGINVNIKTIEITDAFRRIADGRSWEQLNAYEQAQVRTLAILEQSTKKYGTTVTETSATVRNQYQAAYEDFQNTWGQVINKVLIPVLKVLTQVFTIATKGLQIIAGLTGKTIDTSTAFSSQEKAIGGAVDNQEALTDAVKGTNKELKKSLAGFDEINILTQDTAESGDAGATGINGGVSGIGNLGGTYDNSFVDKIDADLAAIMGSVGFALAAIGIIMICFGHIGWGIGFLIAGAGIFAVSQAALSEGAEAEKVKNIMNGIITEISLLALVLGIILVATGGSLPLGIGLIIVGAAGIATEVALNWNAITTAISDFFNNNAGLVVGISLALLVLGILLLVTGAGIPLGISLVVAGVAGLVTEVVLNWNYVTEQVTKFFQDNEGLIVGISLALLVLGIVLCVCGIVTPLSIGMIVAGAAGLVAEIALNWNYVTEQVTKFFQDNAGLIVGVSLALLVIGIILCFTGVGIPLAIGLIVAGATALAAEVALNWDYIKNKTVEIFNNIMDWVKTWGLLILGIILIVSGVGIPLGIALMKKGGANLTEAQDPLWTAIVDKVKEVWETIKTFWNTHIAPIFTAQWWADLGKRALNGLIGIVEKGLNFLIDKINSFIGSISSVVGVVGDVLGQDWSIPEIPPVTIPRLAQGAVIPPNREFLAVLGDQKHGTNIEAPLQTIVDAFNIALQGNANYGGGNTEIVLEIDGREFGRAVVEQGNRENRRIGTRLVIA